MIEDHLDHAPRILHRREGNVLRPTEERVTIMPDTVTYERIVKDRTAWIVRTLGYGDNADILEHETLTLTQTDSTFSWPTYNLTYEHNEHQHHTTLHAFQLTRPTARDERPVIIDAYQRLETILDTVE
jgi:hypothetical protein